MSKEYWLPITRGMRTLVDEEDYEKLSLYKWLAQSVGHGRFYACRADYDNPPLGRKRRYLLMHRVITDAPPGAVVDHKNRDPLDNRRCNLRVCSPADNTHNRATSKRHKQLSRYKGVSFAEYLNRLNPWIAYIDAFGRRKYLGYFSDENAAAQAYNEAATKLHGEFAYLNDIIEPTRLSIA